MKPADLSLAFLSSEVDRPAKGERGWRLNSALKKWHALWWRHLRRRNGSTVAPAKALLDRGRVSERATTHWSRERDADGDIANNVKIPPRMGNYAPNECYRLRRTSIYPRRAQAVKVQRAT